MSGIVSEAIFLTLALQRKIIIRLCWIISGLNTNNRKAKYYIPNPPKNLLPFSVVAYFWLEELGLSFIVYSLWTITLAIISRNINSLKSFLHLQCALFFVFIDYSTVLEKKFGKPGTEERAKFDEEAYAFYTSQILLDARKNARLTQEELAKRIGTNKSYISRIEKGITIPSVATFYRIVNALGLTVELTPAI